MRITQSMQYAQFLESLASIRERIDQSQSRISSGRKLERPSDDPAGAGEALLARSGIAALERHSSNAEAVRTYLQVTDSAMSQLGDLLSQARTAAVQGASETSGRDAIAVEIDSVRAQVLALARTSFQGRFVFGGTATSASPYDDFGNYLGNTGEIRVQTGEAETSVANIPGSQVFGAGTGVFSALDDLATALRSGDTATIQASASSLEAFRSQVSLVRATAGERMKSIDASLDRNAQSRQALLARVSSIEDADLAVELTRLANDRTAESAALGTGAKISSKSLFDYLG